MSLEKELAAAINRVSAENGSNTPDWILGEFLANVVAAWDSAINRRESYYGVKMEPCGGQSEPVSPVPGVLPTLNDWQPIETAPKVTPIMDGDSFLLAWVAPALGEWIFVVGHWDGDQWSTGSNRVWPALWKRIEEPSLVPGEARTPPPEQTITLAEHWRVVRDLEVALREMLHNWPSLLEEAHKLAADHLPPNDADLPSLEDLRGILKRELERP